MGKHHKRNPGRSESAPFVMIHHWEMDCPAYRSLSANSRALYLEFKRRFNGRNNGEIHFSVREMQSALGVGSMETAIKAQQDLQRKGFIAVVKLATFDTRKERTATIWALTCEDVFGARASKNFMRWQSNDDNFDIRGRTGSREKNSSKN